MELYLIRHGEIAGDPHQEYHAPPRDLEGCLSETGVRQAAALGDAMVEVRFDRVFASPLGRAIQTAQPLTRQPGTSIEVLPWLIEWRPATVLGECDETEYETILAEASRRRPEACWKTPAGEGTLEMTHRVVTGFLATMASLGVHAGHGGYLLDTPDDERRIAMVAHGGSLGVLTAFLLGVPIRPHAPVAFEQTGMAVFTFRQRVDVWYPTLRLTPPYPTERLNEPDLTTTPEAAKQSNGHV
ncbi:MAG: histidine phosphatase family protein [Phycisphaeraceae bacterium]